MNPITAARVSAGLSKQEFARRMRVSRTFILRSEEGCYHRPSSNLIKFSTNTLGISNSEFMRQYTRFQSFTRKKSAENIEPLAITNLVDWETISKAGLFVPGPLPVGAVSNSVNDLEINSSDIEKIELRRIFKKWREGYWNTYVSFCKSLCVHPASVQNYESGDYSVMPDQMITALNDANLMDSSFNPNLKWCYVSN